jgi:flavodoxin/NAD-dependent dihydropyrimidine dehydrogenase PreA subunit
MNAKNVLIAEFSQTGSTIKVGDQIAMGLQSSGCEVCFHTINGTSLPDLNDVDIIGIGTPAYAFRPPFLVMDFVDSLPDLKGKSFFVFTLHGTLPGDTGNIIRKKLQNKHGRDIGYFLCFGADYFIGYLKRGYLFSPDAPTKIELALAFQFGKLMVRRHQSDITETEKYDQSTPFVYAIERFLTNRLITKMVYTKMFKVNNRCNGCEICLKKCPTHNIVMGIDKKPVWHKNCLLCATCELKCPKDAITSNYDSITMAPFMIYNIHKAKAKKIPFVRVRHEDGMTKMV